MINDRILLAQVIIFFGLIIANAVFVYEIVNMNSSSSNSLLLMSPPSQQVSNLDTSLLNKINTNRENKVLYTLDSTVPNVPVTNIF